MSMPIDYKAANVAFRKQKSALTRAINSGDVDKVEAACRKAVHEWDHGVFGGAWPDDWSRWQRALDDAYSKAGRGVFSAPRLEDI